MTFNIFQNIRKDSVNQVTVNEYTINEAIKPQNRSLNRYRDVLPYDQTRVILKRGVCDYIHANLIKVNIKLYKIL